MTCGAREGTEFDALWADLGGTDAAKAHAAVWGLAASPAAVPFLQKRLEVAPLADSKKLLRLIDELAKENAGAAVAELEFLGAAAAPLLREVLAGKRPPPPRRASPTC